MPDIHPTAIIEDGAAVAADCVIGPYCVIGGGVTLSEGVVTASHVVIEGDVEIGARTKIGAFSAIGGPAQHLRASQAEPGKAVIGADCILREHVTINAGMLKADRATRVGNRCFLMTGSHVAHDCSVDDDVIITNQGTLAGHVHVGQGAIIGGICAIHQHVRIGEYSFVGGMTGVEFDVIPFGMVLGNRARLEGLNIIGLKRRGVSRADIQELRAAYERLFESGEPLSVAQERFGAESGNALVNTVIAFIRADSKRRFCVPARD
ncbi:MAG: acyl-ACP--UDP-N-acetylglucosamine O-acyltransferase [Rhodobiaceae bacterium]|nr:acyl-ACP--UDP-N-acetylglucosamine O-acyltransferase [Rhodobiaceae bacterium]MCC0057504.1 acyl-ACP--UDP-N-acetylglucosamine O-acyltransferase [Rhodobiaceae bacterium]